MAKHACFALPLPLLQRRNTLATANRLQRVGGPCQRVGVQHCKTCIGDLGIILSHHAVCKLSQLS